MFRGMTKFVCDNCGHKFKGMDCEYCATALTAPVKCPECGSRHTRPSSGLFFSSNKYIYKEIWKTLDEKMNNTEKQ